MSATPLEPHQRLTRSRLLAHREELAAAAVEHLAHDLPGADPLWRAVDQVEQLLHDQFPHDWRRAYAQWIHADAREAAGVDADLDQQVLDDRLAIDEPGRVRPWWETDASVFGDHRAEGFRKPH